jgi:UDPglucose 6-dehydrogenase
MKKISVIGTGYVGLVSGACYAELGNQVYCLDTNEEKVKSLNAGKIPIYEPGLETVVQRNLASGRLKITSSYKEALEDTEFIFVCVGTPLNGDGLIDMRYVESAYDMIAENMNGSRPIIINKSTVPPGTAEMMTARLSKTFANGSLPSIVSNPEFLRESHAVSDFMKPTRIVIGTDDSGAAEAVAGLHSSLDCPVIFTSTRAAEMIKYVSNAFLSMKISFINEIAAICDEVDVDVTEVAKGIGMDPRIGKGFLRAGIGFGGSCLPKDLAGIIAVAEEHDYTPRILKAVSDVNEDQSVRLVDHLTGALGTLEGKRIAVLGVTFKPDTDDIRSSPALRVIGMLEERGAKVRAADPQNSKNMPVLPVGPEYFCDPFEAAQDCDAAVLATEWTEFRSIDLARLKSAMRGKVFVDGRNVIDPKAAKAAGLRYVGVGRHRDCGC